MAIEDFLTVAAPTNELIETDAVIVGAGPVGLFQVFELGLLEIKCHVIDSLRNVGGQCVELYPTKPIYDIPAVPVCTSYELTENLLKQNHHFQPVFHLGEEVTEVKKLEDGTFHVETSLGSQFHCKVVIIAAGVGSFQPRPLRVKDIEKFEGTQLHYSCKDPSVSKAKMSSSLAAATLRSTGHSTSSARPKALCSCIGATASVLRPHRWPK